MSTETEKRAETPIQSQAPKLEPGEKPAAASAPAMTRLDRWKHRLKLAIIWPAVACLALAVLSLLVSIASYYVLIYPPLQQRIVRFAEEVAAEYLLGEVTIERFESNLLSYVDIYGLRAVGKSEYRDSVYVGHINVRYWIPALVRRRFHVTSATVTDVRGHVVMEEGNRIMLPILPLYLLDSAYNLIPEIERIGPELRAEAERLGIGLDSASQAANRKADWDDPAYRAIPKELRQTLSEDIPKPSDWPLEIVVGHARIDGISAVYRDLANDMVGEIINASATARFHALDSFSVQLRVPDGSYRSPWWSGEIDTIGVDGTVTWTGLEVRSLLLKGAGTNVTASGSMCYFPDGPWDLKANFITSVKPLPILHEVMPGLGMDGIFEGTATYKGRLYEPIWRASVKGHNVVYDGVRVAEMNVDAMFDRDEYGRARVRGGSEFGRFDVTAAIYMKDIMFGPTFGDYSATANLSGLNMGRIANKFGVDLPLPIDTGSVRISASGRSPNGVDFEIPSMVDISAEVGGENMTGGRIDATAVIRNAKEWAFNGFWGENSVEARGRFDMATGKIGGTVNADAPHPSVAAMMFANERASGSIAVAAEFDGRIDKLEKMSVSANINGNDIRWRGMFADSLDARISLTDGQLQIHRASGYASGNIDSLVALFLGHDSIGGYVSADFSMRGGESGDIYLNALVRGNELRYGGFTLDTLSGFASMERDTVRWRGLYLKGLGASLRSSGQIILKPDTVEVAASADLYDEYHGERKLAGTVDVNGAMVDSAISGSIACRSVPLNLFDPWIPEEHRMKGVVSLTGDFSGTVSNPSADVRFNLENPGYGGHDVLSITGSASIADSLVAGAAVIRLGETSAPIEVKANLPLLPSQGWAVDETGARTATAGASSSRFSISEAAERMGEELKDFELIGAASFDVGLTNAGAGWNIGGRVTLHDGFARFVPENISIDNLKMNAVLSGSVQNPKAEFAVSTGRARMPNLRMDRSVIRGRSGIDALEVDSARFVFRDTGVVDLRGRLSYEGIDSLFDNNRRFFAQYRISNLPLAVFSRFLDGMGLQGGAFNGSGVIYGGNGRPLVDGTLTLNDVAMELADITPSIDPVGAALRFADSTVYVDSLSAKWGRGSLSGAGSARWNPETGLRDVDLRVRAAELAFELPEVVYVGVSGADLRVSDRDNGFLISGRATLGHTKYVRDLNFIELINQAQIGDVSRAPDPFLESVQLYVDVDLNNNAGIDMNLGSLTADGRLTLAGTLGNPGFVGRINILDGYVYYIDRKFNITEGTLFNPDQNAINPTLRIVAKSDVTTFSPTSRMEQFTITLTLTGSMEEPVIRFTAEPSLSELDILSILTLGERMGGMGTDLDSRLANMAAQQILGIGARRLEKLLNIDRVSVSGNLLGVGDQGSDMTIGTTKRFTNRLSVSYEINTGRQINQKATAQYRLLHNLYLEGQTTSTGENAVNLTYRYSK